MDPDAEEGDQESWSTYQFGFNNAVRYNDLDGRQAGPGGGWVQDVADFANGAANAVASNATTVTAWNGQQAALVSRREPGSGAYAAGQAVGDAVSLVVSVGEMAGGLNLGLTGAVGGLATSPSGVGAAAGVGMAGAGAGITLHGASTFLNAGRNLLSGNNGRVYAKDAAPGSRAGKDFTPKEKAKVIEANKKQNGGVEVCAGCNTPTTPPAKSQRGVTPPKTERQIDHIKPKSMGGSGTAENRQILCRDCNRKKATTTMGDRKQTSSDAYSKVLFHYTEDDNDGIESAWATKEGAGFRLENILFYAKEYSHKDLIRVESVEGDLYATGLLEESGNSTVRIVFHDESQIGPVRQYLQKLGCDSEVSDKYFLIAVNIPKEVSYNTVKQYLDEGEEEGLWGYQEACIAHDN